jgi:catechol 2,3-dioxygenase-like lactoylglutathione lyase family enzyme
MAPLSRRDALKYGALAVSPLFVTAAIAAPKPYPDPTPTNPLAARANIYTVVTPDMAASIRFYTDVMGYELIDKGALAGRPPTVAGAGEAGRKYALIRPYEAENGVVRLLEAPKDAAPNRPRPGALPWDPGLAVIECGARDYEESYRKLTEAGVKTISPPEYYFFHDVEPLPGVVVPPKTQYDIRSYSPYGPAGEQLFITTNVRDDRPAWKFPGLHSPLANTVLACLDRGPVWGFYAKIFGLKPTSDIVCQQESTNRLIGAPPDTYFRWGGLGQAVSIEWDEYRKPSGVTYPTSLDRTGLAMFTLRVDDIAMVRSACRDAGIVLAGKGALPTPESRNPNGFYIRGAVGELIEVIA